MAENELKVVIIGGSAGSLEVLMRLLPKLPNPIPFALVIVVHRKSADDTILEELIAAKTKIPVQPTEDKIPIFKGNIYIAPSDYHLLFEKNHTIAVDNSEKINYSRPSIDVTFQSAAEIFTSNTTAILLSGANTDGSKGLQILKTLGAITIVQNPETAEMPFMPQTAIQNSNPHFIFSPEEIIQYLQNFQE
ncbi:chemotaxis protein CheB [Flavobacterium sp. NST-5]|uniref:protein-glutamate methylesterase n=1 Tax=Flavobacterium ichthyis TaxID=2698827 RepID=A0ABW9ZEN8_9FLAO|nr:chemotaxis protein CheB [Flavobacterium ichthyis]NBL65727.1 chemotaxis protein CheB [Flavobacterium ichthyis]